MMSKQSTICFSGHRSERLPKPVEGLDELKLALYDEIERAIEDGFDTFLFGAAYGYDLLCAEIVLLRKKVIKKGVLPCIKLVAILPFEEQSVHWSENDREQYYNILPKCDEVITLSKKFYKGAYFDRNRFMVDNSSRLICFYDGSRSGTGQTVSYAKQKGCEIINLYKRK